MADGRMMVQSLPRLTFAALVAFILGCQLFLGAWGVDDAFTRGHNGFNSSAYLLSARNALRFQRLFPYQGHTDPEPPELATAYTHAPLATHLANTAAVALVGDRPLAVRGVAAVNGLAVVAALLWVVAAHWSPAHGLLAAAVYVVLPINAIYVTMTNHSLGFQFWSLLTLHSYLRFRATGSSRWFLALLASTWLATCWDWPAYYVAAIVALDALVRFVGARRRVQAHASACERSAEAAETLRAFVRWFASYCALVLLSLASFLFLVLSFGGGSADLLKTFADRQTADSALFERALAVVPRLMFSIPVLCACAVYLLDLLVRSLRARTPPRDLIPLAFACAGALHALLFKDSTVTHEYWLWPALPFAAIATADLTLRLFGWARRQIVAVRGRGLRVALSLLSATLVSLLPLSLLAHSLEVVPRGRKVGGSMWFVSNARRDIPDAYDSGRAELRLAELVRAETDRTTGVLVHQSLARFGLELRFEATLDRAQRPAPGPGEAPPVVSGVDGWVLIGAASDLDDDAVLALAGDYAVTFFDHYFLIDRRNGDRSVRVIRLALRDPRLSYQLFGSVYEPEVAPVRDRAREAELMRARALASAR
jgi:hypothetical protein